MNSLEMMDVQPEDSLNQSIGKAKRHYSSLFTLPSTKKALAIIAALCLAVGLSTAIFFPSVQGIINGLLLGVSLLGLNLLFDAILSRGVLKENLIFVFRRTLGVSLFSWLFWIAFIVLGIALGLAFGFLWWVRFCLLGFAVLITLRAVVFFSVLSEGLPRKLAAVLLQPFACIVPFVVFWYTQAVDLLHVLPFIALAPIIACGFALLFVSMLDRLGKKAYGTSTITIFKAFLLNWITSENSALENYFEKLGEDADVEVSLLKFDSAKPKAAFIVPLVHPGPFKNIGSSLLPSLLKQKYQEAFGAEACVPLGLLGHELDAASQTQNHKIINHTLKAAEFQASDSTASPYVSVCEGTVTVSCQVFGKTVFLSFTLAPKTTEDLPQQLGSIVREEAKKQGFDHAIVVNAHNSLTETTEIEATIEQLQSVAVRGLQKASSQPKFPFEVGTATVYPSEFTLKDGMGTGGITAVTVKVGDQKTAYVVIDGNNMVSGLREKILSSLKAAGFQESEVFTTDTHAVSALAVGRRGYHPVGEVMNEAILLSHIKRAAQTATERLEPCKAGSISLVVPKVRVIGGECIESLTLLVDRTIQKAKHIVAPVFGGEGLILLLLLLLL